MDRQSLDQNTPGARFTQESLQHRNRRDERNPSVLTRRTAPPAKPSPILSVRYLALTSTLSQLIVDTVTDLSFDNWMTQLRKGLLELAVLNSVAAAPLYGYDIVRRLSDVDHLVITEGTVYPILSRLRNSGLVETYIEESQEGPARKYYRLTPRGRAELHRMNQHWDSLHQAVGALRKQGKR
jgi:PadR family transcriptional regulator PadR